MTEMEVREKFGQFLIFKNDLVETLEEIKTLENQITSGTVCSDLGLKVKSSFTDKLTDRIIDKMELEKVCNEELRRFQDFKKEIADLIALAPTAKQKVLLSLTYLNGMKDSDIARLLHTTKRTLQRTRSEAIKGIATNKRN